MVKFWLKWPKTGRFSTLAQHTNFFRPIFMCLALNLDIGTAKTSNVFYRGIDAVYSEPRGIKNIPIEL